MLIEFSAELNVSSYTIDVKSNTFWSCKSEGNFKLSTYNGSGDTKIDIIIPDDVTFTEGFVYFLYSDKDCNYEKIEIPLAKLCYISTNPNYIKCGNENIIYLYYKESGEIFNVSIFCYGGWFAYTENDLKYITNENEIMIISNGEDGEIVIKTNNNCEEKGKVYIRLVTEPKTCGCDNLNFE